MKPTAGAADRVVWLFWSSTALVAVGGIAPLVLGGTSSRANGVVLPFGAAAVAFAGCALMHHQGRVTSSILYFVAGLAIVFGLLSLFSLPLRLAVLGTCPAPPAPCTSGLERPLTDVENTGIAVASAFGIVALLVGFFALATLYRRTVVLPPQPPTRKIPPVPAVEAATETAVAREPRAEASSEPEQEAEPELPAHEEEELPELPAHEAAPPTT